MILQQRLVIHDGSQVGEARRTAAQFSRLARLSEVEAGRIAILVTELGTNLVKHAGGGELFVRELSSGTHSGVEVLSIDHGRGMDVERALQDGHSTTGTRGEGLGAVRRLADDFDGWSDARGTVLMARVWTGGRFEDRFDVGGVCLPLEGEAESGDGWAWRATTPAVARVLIADGLGHGPIAARAATAAVQAFSEGDRLPGPEAIVHSVHAGLRSTRGAAVGVAELDLISRNLRFCGVGNVAATLETPGERARGLLSHNGIAGHEARRIQEVAVPWPSRGALVMHSDGLQTQWKIEAYSGLQSRRASVIAGVLFRDYRRKSDDATIVVAKEP
ncbi:MAG TPA: ATP-binding protein [Myxococcales bacterium]|nr:ATP-binding protein [Myxococcales bacterium]